ncbi:MAG: NAD(+) synthase [Ruminococcus sp.]|jgi:NAD+ synthase (glutamine-hydrolysing)|nr:NAD(+) synthase [Ruminococcus sp.]
MRNGFFRTAAVSPKLILGDPDKNAEIIAAEAERLAALGVKLAVFPELCLTGYSCGDLFLTKAFADKADAALKKLINLTKELDIICAVGLPIRQRGKLFNCAVFIAKGGIENIFAKSHIPNYNEFYEARQFTPYSEYTENFFLYDLVRTPNKPSFYRFGDFEFGIGAELCEDLWVTEPPSGKLAAAGATIIVNLSASNALIGKEQYRRDLIKNQSARCVCAYIYANAGNYESTSDCVFDGHSVIAENGVVLAESEPFSDETAIIADIDLERLENERARLSTFGIKTSDAPFSELRFDETHYDKILRSFPRYPFVPSDLLELGGRCRAIIEMQSRALARRLSHTKAKTALIGLSGGLDSTLAFIVTVRAFDIINKSRDGIIAVTMPCFGTTNRTKNNAITLAGAFGTTLREIDITEAVRRHFADIGQSEDCRDVTYENCQARERTQVLMDLANKTGGIVIGTGDLSEAALGFATYNGDHMSMYAVNIGVPKTLVRHLVKFAADTGSDITKKVLYDILDTPVSPELLPPEGGVISQRTEDIVGPYELHDFFLYYFVRCGFSPEKIARIALQAWEGIYSRETVEKWLDIFIRRFYASQFKRNCTPDGVKVGSVSLSPRADWRMPGDIDYFG